VEIEFKITSLKEMARRPVSMFSYDLVAGHRVLYSTARARDLPGCHHHHGAESIPTSEATRLLMNRCTGLLLARIELEDTTLTARAADFVRRNIAKVQLACGDAVLTAFGRYHWSCRERHHRLLQLAASEPWPWLDGVTRHHAVGVEFKLHPTATAPTRDELLALHREVSALAQECWLCLEARRLHRAFPTARAYAVDRVHKCPGTDPLLNFLLNLRAQGGPFSPRPNPWPPPHRSSQIH